MSAEIQKSIFIRAARKTGRTLRRMFAPVPAQRHENPYATLLPVLTALACRFNVRRVVEFGCGYNSTLTFLNRDIYPALETLTSIENDSQWMESIRKSTSDSRLRILQADGAVSECVTNELLADAQLILVDDSTCAADRSATIRAVAERLQQPAILVIHDFEVPDYQQASSCLPGRFAFDALLPNTGVLCTEPLIDDQWFRRMNSTIRKYSNCICPTDTVQWRQKLGRL